MTEESALPYLKYVLDVTQFHRRQANIIVAPCHSGKTSAAGKIICEHARCPERVLYLIDTTAGKQALLTHKDTAKFTRRWSKDLPNEWWGSSFDGSGFRVITYHKLGLELQANPLFIFDLDLIICDEMHNLIKYIGIEHSNNKRDSSLDTENEIRTCRVALNAIAQAASRTKHTPLVVIMSATINSLTTYLDGMHVPFETFDYTARVHSDRTEQTFYYADFETVFQQLEPDTRAIIYVPTVSLMKKFADIADDGWRSICCLWSIHNAANEMDQQQLDVREHILKHQRIPDHIDLLFINAAYETSLNILNEDFNTMIVHSGNPDVQVQARGRLRHDIKALYLYDTHHMHIAEYFPCEYYDRYLYAEDTAKIAALMNLKNEKGRDLKWRSIAESLRKDAVIVNKLKKSGKRCWMVHRNPNMQNGSASGTEISQKAKLQKGEDEL